MLPHTAAAQAKSPREASCRVQAGQKGLQGAERQQYMAECLGKAGKPAAKENSRQRCSREAAAKGLKGPERAAYLARCGQ